MEPKNARSQRLEIVGARDDDVELLATFFRSVWDPNATAETVAAARNSAAQQNVAESGVVPPTWLAIQSGKVLGYVTTIPVRLWNGSAELPAYLIKGLMVLPEQRNGPIGYLVTKAAVAALPRSGALAVADPARRLFVALGFTDLGAIPNWVRPLSVGRMLNRIDVAEIGGSRIPAWALKALELARKTGAASLIGGLAGGAIRGAAFAGRLGTTGELSTSHGRAIPSEKELDELWQRSRSTMTASVVRDSKYLIDRYPVDASPYTWVDARSNGKLVGVAVVREPRANGDPRLRGVRVATIADVLFPQDDPSTGLALLGEAERQARQLCADAILASTPAHSLDRLLRRQCYARLSGNVHFLFRDMTEQKATYAASLADWWLTRGDGLSDEVF